MWFMLNLTEQKWTDLGALVRTCVTGQPFGKRKSKPVHDWESLEACFFLPPVWPAPSSSKLVHFLTPLLASPFVIPARGCLLRSHRQHLWQPHSSYWVFRVRKQSVITPRWRSVCCPELASHVRNWIHEWGGFCLIHGILGKHQFSSVIQLCPTLWDPMNCSTPGLPVHHQLLEFTQTHIHLVSDAIQPSHPLSSPSLALIFPSIRVFSDESALCIRWPKCWSFSFYISPSNEHPGPIFFRMDSLDLLIVQGLLRVFSTTTVQKHQFCTQLSL